MEGCRCARGDIVLELAWWRKRLCRSQQGESYAAHLTSVWFGLCQQGRGSFLCSCLNLIDRYVLREWLKVLGLVLAAILGLLLMQAMYDDFRDLLDDGASVAEMARYYAIKVPSYFAIVLPLSLLVSLLYALGQLHRNNEIVAMRAAGVGVFRITRSIWAIGVLACGLVWLLNSTVVPKAVELSAEIREEIQFRHELRLNSTDQAGLTRVVTFDNQRQGRMWIINRYSKYQKRAFGVSVSELDSQRREKTRLRAREAFFDEQRGCWVFFDGRESWIDPETGDLLSTRTFSQKVVSHFKEDPSIMLVFDVKPGDLSFYQLRQIIDYFTIQENPKVTRYAMRYFEILAQTFGPLIIMAIAIPFAISGVRVNPAVGVSKALGLFALYYVLTQLATGLGTRGLLDPMTAALVPSGVMLLVGGVFFVRLR